MRRPSKKPLNVASPLVGDEDFVGKENLVGDEDYVSDER